MTNKFNFSCLFVAIVALGFSGIASADSKVKKTQVKTQQISFGAAPKVTVSGKGTVTVSASSGLPVVLVSKTSVCSISGKIVTGLTTGTCIIAADQAGNTTYAKAAEAFQSFSVTNVQVSGGGKEGSKGGDGVSKGGKEGSKGGDGVSKGGKEGSSGSGNISGNGGTKLAVTAPFDCTTLASSGNAADDGRRAYNRLNCVSCHGQDGSGGMGPDIRGGGENVAEAVNGDGAMPSYAGFLCPNDVIDLQAYLGSISQTVKYLDWDLPVEQIKDGAAAATATGVVVGP